jgi:hypothetical protein
MDLVSRAELACAREIRRIVHRHARGALHHRLHDQRGSGVVMGGEMDIEGVCGRKRVFAWRYALGREPGVRRGDRRLTAQQRPVSIAEERDIGHRQGTDRLAMISMGHADEIRFAGVAHVAPVMEAHLQRNLDRRCAVGGVETVTGLARRDGRQSLGELDHRLMSQAGQHDVLELCELVDDGGIDCRVSVPEQVDPPGADCVEIAVTVEIVQPGAAAARDRNQRRRLVLFHLRARMPDRRAAARKPVFVAGHEEWKAEASTLYRRP